MRVGRVGDFVDGIDLIDGEPGPLTLALSPQAGRGKSLGAGAGDDDRGAGEDALVELEGLLVVLAGLGG